MSLRSTPITRRASLPDGRIVVIRVGVPEDPYISRRELDTVALELLEDDAVVATVNTVLDADDDAAAGELAAEVARGLEAGEIEPTAAAIEPFGDEPR